MADPAQQSGIPLDYQADFDNLNTQKAIAQYLRVHAGEGTSNPGLAQGVGAIGRLLFGDPMAGIAEQEKALTQRVKQGQQDAMTPLIMAQDPMTSANYSPQDMAAMASQGYAAGVPPQLIQAALQNNQAYRMLQNPAIWGGQPSQQAMQPQGTGAPQGPQQAPPGPSAMPFLNAPQQSQGQQGPQDPNAAAVAETMNRQIPGMPLANMPDAQLIVASKVLAATSPNSPYTGIVNAALEARKITAGPDGIFTRAGLPVAQISRDGYLTDLQSGKVIDLHGAAAAVRAGGVAAAEGDAKAARTPIQTVDSQGRPVTTFATNLPGYGGAPQGQPAPQVSGQVNLGNFPTNDAAQAAALAAMKANPNQASVALGPVPSGGAPDAQLGTGPNPVALKGAEAEAEGVGKAMAGQMDKIDAAAENAQAMSTRVKEMRTMLPMFQPGAVAPAREQMAAFLQGVGAPDSVVQGVAGGNLPAMQAYAKQTLQMAFEATKQLTPRPAAAEVMLQLKANPNLAMTAQAQSAVLDYMQGIAEWQGAKQTFKDQYVSEHGTWRGGEGEFNKQHPATDYIPSAESLKAALGGAPSAPAATTQAAAPSGGRVIHFNDLPPQ